MSDLTESDINVNIVIVHHKEDFYIKNECFMPIQVGVDNVDYKLDYCVFDNSGENISHKNKNWCELTALYWQWKNIDADYYGLFHYRRYLSFKHKDGVFNEVKFDNETKKEHNWNSASIKRICKRFDIITAPFFDIHPAGLPDQIMTAYDFYARDHYEEDLKLLIEIVKSDFSFFYDSLIYSLNQKKCYFGNIHIMKKEYYMEYCNLIFSILGKLEKRIDLEGYSGYQSRVYGFLAERLSNAFIFYLKTNNEKINITSMAQVGLFPSSFDNLGNIGFASKYVEVKNNVNICLTFDDNYLYHAISTIMSLVDNFYSNNSLIVNIIYGDNLSENSRRIVKDELGSIVLINFIFVEKERFLGLPLNRDYININTYFRLLICELFPKLDKIIYIDSDTIVLGNIAELWNFPIANYLIGAALDEGGVMQTRRLGLNSNNNYFNAGVLLFNLEEIRGRYEGRDLFDFFINCYLNNVERISLQDQDILNIAFENDSKIIPLCWNVNSRIFNINVFDRKYSLNDEIDAVNNIKILHYTDKNKPWKFFSSHPYSDMYWRYRFKLSRPRLTFQEKVSYLNHRYLKINYSIYGVFVIFYFLSFKIRVKKSLINYFLNIYKGR